MIRRLFLLALVVAGLAPGTYVRTQVAPAGLDAGVTITRLERFPSQMGPFSVLGAWQLESENALFGSYSALGASAPGRYLSLSDKGTVLRFGITGYTLDIVELTRLNPGKGFVDKHDVDVEALTIEPGAGTVWLAYEGRNVIERRSPDLALIQRVRPEAMADWRSNSGPEAMARMPDGSFIVIGEGKKGWVGGRLPAVRFAGDPVASPASAGFAFGAPSDFRPTDMALLPDGRVLFLLRRIEWGLPPRFEIGLMVADPADIVEGETWTGTLLTTFSHPFPTDNYEGLSVESDGDYPVTATLISDDNGISYQRTLVLQLQWDGRGPFSERRKQQKARGLPSAPLPTGKTGLPGLRPRSSPS
ncbi:MAG: esterase-like activity of phytase family protein [Sphingomonadaceae bacterium]|nr:MAG: esterase-like activity of phytase family protein [Sphingomonadaceae bacterium]